MATPYPMEDDSSDSADETLDPLSPMFDPVKALYSPLVRIPVPGAKQFNNLSEFENYMQGKDAKTLAQKKQEKQKKQEDKPKLAGIVAERAAQQAREASRKAALTAKGYQGPVDRSNTQLRKQRVTTVLTRMERCKRGPMSLLQRCVKDRLRVVVIVRAAVTLRSLCKGYIIAFDKHMNMALMDVDETYLKPVKKDKATSKQISEGMEALSTKSDSGKHPAAPVSTTTAKERDAGKQRGGDLREKLSSKGAKTKSSEGSRVTVKEESTGSMTDRVCAESPFWRAYKPWAEQRSYTTYEIMQRHANQLFLRGDNVVSVMLDQG